MKNIIKFLICIVGFAGLVSCETYKVEDPEQTAVGDFDGRWICFAYDKADQTNPVGLYIVEIFNTTFNDSDKFWMSVADCDPVAGGHYFLDALKFKTSCDVNSLTFNASDVEASQPRTCYNIYLEQGYFTLGYRNMVPATGYKVSLRDGKVTKNGIDTDSGYKADAIEFSYKRTNPDNTTVEYVFKGMKNTGWAEDMGAYYDFIDAQGW